MSSWWSTSLRKAAIWSSLPKGANSVSHTGLPQVSCTWTRWLRKSVVSALLYQWAAQKSYEHWPLQALRNWSSHWDALAGVAAVGDGRRADADAAGVLVHDLDVLLRGVGGGRGCTGRRCRTR